MKPIKVQDQVRLGPGRCLMLALSGMYYRLMRSAITVLILSLAVAFLSYVLSYGILSHDAEYAAYTELKSTHLAGEWVSRLSVPDQKSVIFSNILAMAPDRLHEYSAWGSLTEKELFRAESAAIRLNRFYDWFSAIPLSSRVILIADKDPAAVAEELTVPDKMETFSRAVASLRLKPPLGSMDAAKKVIADDVALFADIVGRIQEGQGKAILSVQQKADTVAIISFFLAQSEDFRASVAAAGFVLPRETFSAVAKIAAIDADVQKLASVATNPDIQAPVARHLGIFRTSEATMPRIVGWCTTRARAEWLADLIDKKVPGIGLTPEKLENIGKSTKRATLIERIAPAQITQKRQRLLSLPPKALWLILLSFVVCVVGISNTMLMSVTDRFSEIATMKCIGAMDGFIMLLFVFEAFFQAIVGSAIGVVLGFLLSFFRGLASYSVVSLESLHLYETFMVSALSFATGILIAAIAATWPSWAAARLAPMEAMRVE